MDNTQYIPFQKKAKKLTNGRWTKTQKDRFITALEKYGKDWVMIQKFVKSRTQTQIRSHAQKVFLKMSQEDKETIIGGQNDFYYSNDDHVVRVKRQKKRKFAEGRKEQKKFSDSKGENKMKKSLLDIFKRAIQMEVQQGKNNSEVADFEQENFIQATEYLNSSKNNILSSCSFGNLERDTKGQNHLRKLYNLMIKDGVGVGQKGQMEQVLLRGEQEQIKEGEQKINNNNG